MKMNDKGYYADVSSPIASSPLKRARKREDEMEQTPVRSSSSLSAEVKVPEAETWTPGRVVQSLFSPVLKFFSGGDEDEEEEDESALRRKEEEEAQAEALARAAAAEQAAMAVDESESDVSWDEVEFNPYLFMKSLPPYEEVCPPHRGVRLPKRTRTSPPISLVLDLDETLVHCSIEAIDNADLVFPVDFNGQDYQVHVRKRPHLDFFLNSVCNDFEVIVFTASQRVYAEKLLNILDPTRKLIKYRLYRDACLPVEGNYLKDLVVLGRDLSQVVLVDNSPHAFGYQVDNGIPIESWFDDEKDTELLKLLPFLKSLKGKSDVRPLLQNQFHIQDLIDKA